MCREPGRHSTLDKGHEEASGYLTEALLSCTCGLIEIIVANAFIFRAKKDWRSALDAASQALEDSMSDPLKAGAKPA